MVRVPDATAQKQNNNIQGSQIKRVLPEDPSKDTVFTNRLNRIKNSPNSSAARAEMESLLDYLQLHSKDGEMLRYLSFAYDDLNLRPDLRKTLKNVVENRDGQIPPEVKTKFSDGREVLRAHFERAGRVQAGMWYLGRSFADFKINMEAKLNGKVNIILLNISGVKRINDTFSHEAGNEFLSKLTEQAIEKFFREKGIEVKVYRDGGSFIIDLPGDMSKTEMLEFRKELKTRVEGNAIKLENGKTVGLNDVRTRVIRYDGQSNPLTIGKFIDAILYQTYTLNRMWDPSLQNKLVHLKGKSPVARPIGHKSDQLERRIKASQRGFAEEKFETIKKTLIEAGVNPENLSWQMIRDIFFVRYIDPTSGLLTGQAYREHLKSQSSPVTVAMIDGNAFGAFSCYGEAGLYMQDFVIQVRIFDAANKAFEGKVRVFRQGPGSEEFFFVFDGTPKEFEAGYSKFAKELNKELKFEVKADVLESSPVWRDYISKDTNLKRKFEERKVVKGDGETTYILDLSKDPRVRYEYTYNVASRESWVVISKKLKVPLPALLKENGVSESARVPEKVKIPRFYTEQIMESKGGKLPKKMTQVVNVYTGITADCVFAVYDQSYGPEKFTESLDKELTLVKGRNKGKNTSQVRRVEIKEPIKQKAVPRRTEQVIFRINPEEIEKKAEAQTKIRGKIAAQSAPRVIATRTLKSGTIGFIVEFPASITKQIILGGSVSLDQVFVDAKHGAIGWAQFGATEGVAMKFLGISEHGAARFAFFVPSAIAINRNPEQSGLIFTNTTLSYGAFMAGAKIGQKVPGPAPVKGAASLILGILFATGMDEAVIQPAYEGNWGEATFGYGARDFVESETMSYIGQTFALATDLYLAYKSPKIASAIVQYAQAGRNFLAAYPALGATLRFAGIAGALLSLVTTPGDGSTNRKVITGSVQQLADGREDISSETGGGPRIDKKPPCRTIRLTTEYLPETWSIADIVHSEESHPFSFELFFYLYKAGYITREDFKEYFAEYPPKDADVREDSLQLAENLFNALENIDLSNPEAVQQAFEAYCAFCRGTDDLFAMPNEWTEARNIMGELLLNGLREFKEDQQSLQFDLILQGKNLDIGELDEFGFEDAKLLILFAMQK